MLFTKIQHCLLHSDITIPKHKWNLQSIINATFYLRNYLFEHISSIILGRYIMLPKNKFAINVHITFAYTYRLNIKIKSTLFVNK